MDCTRYLFDSTLMLPMMEAELVNEDAEDDIMHTIRTGQIPDQLLQDILEEAEQFMDLFKYNPSRFLTRLTQFKAFNVSLKPSYKYSEMLKSKRKGPFKRTERIVSLTRPRFGKRSSEVLSSVQHGPDLSQENLNRAYIYRYLLQSHV